MSEQKPLTNAEVSAIEKRWSATTPGKWVTHEFARDKWTVRVEGSKVAYDMVEVGAVIAPVIRSEADAKAIASAREDVLRLCATVRATPKLEGHDEPCYYCNQKCNSWAGDPGKWPIPLCHADEPGKVKWHHIGCVDDKLQKLTSTEKSLAESLEKLRKAWENMARAFSI